MTDMQRTDVAAPDEPLDSNGSSGAATSVLCMSVIVVLPT